MPTSHPRVSVTKDPELAESLRRARSVVGGDMSESTLVRRLAIAGADALVADEAERARAIEELADPELGGLDLDVLSGIEQVDLDELTSGRS